MRKKHLIVCFFIAVLLVSMICLTGCGDDAEYDDTEYEETTPANTEVNAETNSETNKDASKSSKGLFMQVDKTTGKMLIRRPEQ